jgi:VWFA-related protein
MGQGVESEPEKAMTGRSGWAAGLFVLLMSGVLWAQQAPSKPPDQNIPDAPSARQKPQNFPQPSPYPPAQTSPTPGEQAPPAQTQPPAAEPMPRTGESSSNQPQPETPTAPPATPAQPGRTAADSEDSRNDLFRLTRDVTFVNVPVTVKDENGRLVDGLLEKDFAIYEDGERQRIRFFTSDPFPLSAAVVIDSGMPDQSLEKVQNTLTALAGSFSQFDEMSLYLYAETVQRVAGFTSASASQQVEAAMRRVKMKNEQDRRTGRQGGVLFAGGPFNTTGPSINGKPVDPNQPLQPIARPEPHALNDAVLMAAQDLGRQDRTRRRVLFIISDGAERGSKTSYADALKVLLTNEVQVYALVVGVSALPIVGRLERVHVPGQGYGNILPKYTSATGGAVVSGLDTKAIEQAYNTATYQARNQYTIGYQTRPSLSDTFHEIEVRVHRPGLAVVAKTGYYSLPPKPPAKTPAEPAPSAAPSGTPPPKP